MGLAIAPLGVLLRVCVDRAADPAACAGVTVGRIAWVSAVGFSPTFWAFLLCPILDVKFSKRAYALTFAGRGGGVPWRFERC